MLFFLSIVAKHVYKKNLNYVCISIKLVFMLIQLHRVVHGQAQRAPRSRAFNLWGLQLFTGYEYNCWDVE